MVFLFYVKVFKMEVLFYFVIVEFFCEILFKLIWDLWEINKDLNEVIIFVEFLLLIIGEKVLLDDIINNEIKIVIIDCLFFNYVDINGIFIFLFVVKEFWFVGVIVFLVWCIFSFLVVMVRFDLMEIVGEGNIYLIDWNFFIISERVEILFVLI